MPCACKNPIDIPSLPAPPEPGYVRCCDCNGCCKDYCKKNRDPFWPGFCSPRWLLCCELYDFHGCGECVNEDICKDYDPCKKPLYPPKPPVPPCCRGCCK